ncbi:MAG: extracellular solute-binding protein [Candidatus Borkfalkiaceae bacterium]|nr:extracellular solute-binding protein [Clostridia bacterium]MDY6223871.1 extracellular solute-binding protein [Christensenellaceae bacterium]
MKNLKKRQLTCLAIGFLVASTSVFAAGCGFKGDNSGEQEKVDPNRKQLYVGYYNGGMGLDWMNQLKYGFEEKYPEYQVMIEPDKEKYSYTNLRSYMPDGKEDIYFTTSIQMMDYKTNGLIADITEAVTQPLTEFGESVSIADKMDSDSRNHYAVTENGKTSYYAIPYFDALYGYVYDVDLFEERKLFISSVEGGKITWTGAENKSVGRDGKAGTFDDGLPETYEQMKSLFNRMQNMGITPVTWAGAYTGYREWFLDSIWAGYEGLSNFKLNYTFSGTDSSLGEITNQNAYLLQQQSGKLAALTLAHDLASKNYASTQAYSTIQTHSNAQTEFLMSREKSSPIAMIIDGGWWEYEARGIFGDMAVEIDQKYAYKTRRFGLMPVPKFVGTEGVPDQKYDGITLYTPGSTAVVVNDRSTRKDIAMKFLRYSTSNEALEIFTKNTGVSRPYDYTLSQESYNNLTYFQKSMWDLYHREDVEIVHALTKNELRMTHQNELYTWSWGSESKKGYVNDPIHTFKDYRDLTVEDYFSGLQKRYSEVYWKEMILGA